VAYYNEKVNYKNEVKYKNIITPLGYEPACGNHKSNTGPFSECQPCKSPYPVYRIAHIATHHVDTVQCTIRACDY